MIVVIICFIWHADHANPCLLGKYLHLHLSLVAIFRMFLFPRSNRRNSHSRKKKPFRSRSRNPRNKDSFGTREFSGLHRIPLFLLGCALCLQPFTTKDTAVNEYLNFHYGARSSCLSPRIESLETCQSYIYCKRLSVHTDPRGLMLVAS